MNKTGWERNEISSAGEEHLDPEYVRTYDRKAAFDPTSDLEILRRHGLNEQSIVVDIGAGTGEFAIAVAPLCERVVAVDISLVMIEQLQEKVSQLSISNLEIVRAGYLSYEHQGAAPDVVYSRNTLHHLPDFWKAVALQRVAEMLEPGGLLLLHDLVYSFEPSEAEQVFEPWLAGAVDRPEDGFTRPELETHIREEYSTFSWLLEPMLERAGFELLDVRHRPSRTYSAYVCEKR